MGNAWKYRMSKKELEVLFSLAEKLYWQEYRKSGMVTPIPYAYAEGEGKFIAVSMFGVDSEIMKKKLRELM